MKTQAAAALFTRPWHNSPRHLNPLWNPTSRRENIGSFGPQMMPSSKLYEDGSWQCEQLRDRWKCWKSQYINIKYIWNFPLRKSQVMANQERTTWDVMCFQQMVLCITIRNTQFEGRAPSICHFLPCVSRVTSRPGLCTGGSSCCGDACLNLCVRWLLVFGCHRLPAGGTNRWLKSPCKSMVI